MFTVLLPSRNPLEQFTEDIVHDLLLAEVTAIWER